MPTSLPWEPGWGRGTPTEDLQGDAQDRDDADGSVAGRGARLNLPSWVQGFRGVRPGGRRSPRQGLPEPLPHPEAQPGQGSATTRPSGPEPVGGCRTVWQSGHGEARFAGRRVFKPLSAWGGGFLAAADTASSEGSHRDGYGNCRSSRSVLSQQVRGCEFRSPTALTNHRGRNTRRARRD